MLLIIATPQQILSLQGSDLLLLQTQILLTSIHDLVHNSSYFVCRRFIDYAGMFMLCSYVSITREG